jgi:hypothetical protein
MNRFKCSQNNLGTMLTERRLQQTKDRESALPVCEAKFVFGFVQIKNTRTVMRNNRHVRRERRNIAEGRKAFQKQAEGKNKVEFAK